MAFQIESNVPMPARVGGRGPGGSKYPFRHMAKGQSFLVPPNEDGEVVKVATIRSAIGAFMKNHKGWKFAVRNTADGVRVWCLGTPTDPYDTKSKGKMGEDITSDEEVNEDEFAEQE